MLLADDTQVVSMYGNTIAYAARWAIIQIQQSE
jgi:hypothetical protein